MTNEGASASASAPEEIVRGATLTDQVYDRLCRGLLHGSFRPGQKITARQLGRELGVSLTPARDALARLATEGAIEISETRTFLVPRLSRERYAEVGRIRGLLEPLAAELAAQNAGPALAGRLHELNERMRAGILAEEFDEALSIDASFHHAIFEAAEATVLRRLIEGLWLQVGPMRTLLPHEYRKRLAGYGIHLEIIAAMRDRDAAAARDAVRRDLADGIKVTLQAMAREEAGPEERRPDAPPQ